MDWNSWHCTDTKSPQINQYIFNHRIKEFFFFGGGQVYILILEFISKLKGTRICKTVLKKNRAGEIAKPGSKTYNTVEVNIEFLELDWRNRIERS